MRMLLKPLGQNHKIKFEVKSVTPFFTLRCNTLFYNSAKRIFNFVLALLLISKSNIAHTKTTAYSDQYWLQYYGQLQLNPKWTILGDGGIRMKNGCKEKAATLGRIGLQLNLNKNLSTAIGGAYFSQYINDKISREEWRGWQELFLKHNFSRFFTNHRLRIEERYFHTLSTRKDNFNFRLRYRFYFTFPLNHPTMQANTLYIIGGDEIFLNFGGQVIYNYDQNRVIAGAGYKLNDNLLINLTYVYQYAQKNTAFHFEKTDIIWLGMIHTIKLKKKNAVPKPVQNQT